MIWRRARRQSSGTHFPEAAMRRRLPFAHQQALAFVGACLVFGAMFGALVAAAKGGLR